jgi:hypothetical protein
MFPDSLSQEKQDVVTLLLLTLLLLLVHGRMTERGMMLIKGPSKQQEEVLHSKEVH